MTGRIVLHVGDRKTATTSIQRALLAGACAAEGVAIDYPVPDGRPNHHALARDIAAGGRKGELRALARRLRASRADIAVISSEHFDRADPAAVRAAFARHLPDLADRIEVLAYVRPHAERLVSSYAQSVKLGRFRGDLAAFHARTLGEGRYLYAPRLGRWRTVFGERYTLVPLIRDRLAGGDAVTDFFHRATRGAPFTLAPPERANESLALADLALLRLFHTRLRRHAAAPPRRRRLPWRRAPRRPRTGPARLQLARYMAEALAVASAGGPRPALHHALATDVAAAYAADAAALDAAFFDATPMADALARAPRKAVAERQSIAARAHFDPPALRAHRLWIDTVGALMARDPASWEAEARALFDAAMRGR